MTETVGLIVGFLLTLFIYSYIVGDNPLYRIAIHLLVGVSAAYALVVAVREVLVPLFQRLRNDPTALENVLWIIPIFLGLLLLLRLAPATAVLGNGALAALIGIGTAVALTGVIAGTLWPQTLAVGTAATTNQLGVGLLSGLLTICTLLYFQYTHRYDSDGAAPPAGRFAALARGQRPVVLAGQVVITITFGAIYANVLSTGLVLLADRLNFYVNALGQAAGGFIP